MKKFRENEVTHSPQLHKQEAAKPNLTYFFPFFQERDGIGKLINEEDKNRGRSTVQTPGSDLANRKRILKEIYHDYVAYYSPRSQRGQKIAENSQGNMSSTQQKFLQSNTEYFPNEERYEFLMNSNTTLAYEKMKIEPPAKAKFLNQGSKFRLTSPKASENFHHYLGSYDTNRAVEMTKKRKPQVFIFKKHEKPNTPQYNQARKLKRNKRLTSIDTHNLQSQASDNIQQDLYRLLHSNNSGSRPTGASIKNALMKYSFKTIPDTEHLLKFNNVMTQSIEDMRKDLHNFRVKLNAVTLKH